MIALLAAVLLQADYAEAMKKVAAKFTGKEGVVLHLGDSITYANPYGGWAKYGKGKTPVDVAALKWMHCGANDWFGTLISNDGVHPTADQGGASVGSEPTEENLKNSGLLLRGVLSVRKIAEVKAKVVDAAPRKK